MTQQQTSKALQPSAEGLCLQAWSLSGQLHVALFEWQKESSHKGQLAQSTPLWALLPSAWLRPVTQAQAPSPHRLPRWGQAAHKGKRWVHQGQEADAALSAPEARGLHPGQLLARVRRGCLSALQGSSPA